MQCESFESWALLLNAGGKHPLDHCPLREIAEPTAVDANKAILNQWDAAKEIGAAPTIILLQEYTWVDGKRGENTNALIQELNARSGVESASWQCMRSGERLRDSERRLVGECRPGKCLLTKLVIIVLTLYTN